MFLKNTKTLLYSTCSYTDTHTRMGSNTHTHTHTHTQTHTHTHTHTQHRMKGGNGRKQRGKGRMKEWWMGTEVKGQIENGRKRTGLEKHAFRLDEDKYICMYNKGIERNRRAKT